MNMITTKILKQIVTTITILMRMIIMKMTTTCMRATVITMKMMTSVLIERNMVNMVAKPAVVNMVVSQTVGKQDMAVFMVAEIQAVLVARIQAVMRVMAETAISVTGIIKVAATLATTQMIASVKASEEVTTAVPTPATIQTTIHQTMGSMVEIHHVVTEDVPEVHTNLV